MSSWACFVQHGLGAEWKLALDGDGVCGYVRGNGVLWPWVEMEYLEDMLILGEYWLRGAHINVNTGGHDWCC